MVDYVSNFQFFMLHYHKWASCHELLASLNFQLAQHQIIHRLPQSCPMDFMKPSSPLFPIGTNVIMKQRRDLRLRNTIPGGKLALSKKDSGLRVFVSLRQNTYPLGVDK